MEPRRSRTLARPAVQPARATGTAPARAERRAPTLTPSRGAADLANIIRQAERPTVPSATRAPAATTAPRARAAERPAPSASASPAVARPAQATPRATAAPGAMAAPSPAAPIIQATVAFAAASASSAGGTAPTSTSAVSAPPTTAAGAPSVTPANVPSAEEPRRSREGGGGGAAQEAMTGGAAGAEGGGAPARRTGGGGGGLLMPEPPETLSPNARARVASVQASASATASAQSSLPPAGEQVADAREAVTTPVAEREARAQGSLVEALGQQPEPSPEIEQLCERIRQVIRNKRPPDEESLVEAKPEEMARDAGSEIGQGVQGEVSGVQGAYQGLQQEPAPAPPDPGQEMPPTPEVAPTPPINARSATPDPVPAANVSLDADVAANQQRMADAGMESEPARLVQDGPISEARRAQGELEQTAADGPSEVLAEQEATLNRSRADMAQLQEAALEALRSSRTRTTTGARTQQGRMVGSEEQMRTQASARAQTIFDEAQRRVEELLRPLTDTAMQRWDAGIQRLSNTFKSDLRRVERSIEERHSGATGALVSLWDAVAGMPDWVVQEYDRAERAFGDGACELARDISRQVNGVIATCEALIEQARADIAQVFSQLPESLQAWAAGEQARLGQSLDGLRDSARQRRDQFNQQLIQQASQAVQEVRQQVHGLRERARGLVGRIADAIDSFLRDPARFIIEGLLSLLGIPPAAFWAVVARIQQVIADIADDPVGFAGNLMRAVGEGFRLFFDNVGSHLLRGLVEWLFSGLGTLGIQIPRDMSLGSLITFFLQLMGISWDRIRRLIAKRIGERNMALLEQAWTIISTLVQQGPAGIFELLKDRLNPREILDQVLTAARDAIMEAVITRVTARILMMFNPVGAILQALEAIYRVLKWIFENAARLFSLVETVVNGIADLLRGNTAGMAKAIEQGLARLIAPVIDFLAGYLGLGNLPDRIRDAIQGMQNWVEGILDRVIGWIADQAQRLLRAMGLGGREQAAPGAPGTDTELGETVRFSADGESHRMWVDVQGTRATIMVASTPASVLTLLDGWNARLGELSDDPDAQGIRPRQRAHGLLIQAQALTRAADTSADTLAQEWRNVPTRPPAAGTPGAGSTGGSTPTPPDDSQLESQEQQLSGILQQLFQLFGDTGAAPVQRFAPQLAMADDTAQPLLRKALTDNATAYQSLANWQAARSTIANDSLTQKMFQGPLNQDNDFGKKFHARGIKEVQKALTDVGAPADERTAEKSESVLINYKGSLHQNLPPFTNARAALLNQIFMGEREAATDAHIYRDYKTRFETEVEGLHDKYKPDILSRLESADGRTLSLVYKGAGDAQFTVERVDGLIREIQGTGLRHKRDLGITLRGYTSEASAYVPDRSMVNAHLIADQFTGSGYKNALNLITTSAYFNDPVMKAIETRIHNTWRAYLGQLESLSLDTANVTFDLKVNVYWMEVLAPQLIPRIMRDLGAKLLAHYPHWDKNNLQQEIAAKLNTGLIGASADLKRVANVKYTLTLKGPHAPTIDPMFTGPDLWIGFRDVKFSG